MIVKNLTLLIVVLFLSFQIIAQNTLSVSESESSPKASIQDVAWISGHWQGEAFGGSRK